MFNIAWTELLIIAIVAITVVGPRELPRMLRSIGNFMGMVKRTAGEFQRQFNDALRETELDEVRKGFDSVRKANPLNQMKDDLNPLKQAGDSVRKAVEDPGAPKSGAAKRSPRPARDGEGEEAGEGGSSRTGNAEKAAGKTKAAEDRPPAKKRTTGSAKPAAKTSRAGVGSGSGE